MLLIEKESDFEHSIEQSLPLSDLGTFMAACTCEARKADKHQRRSCQYEGFLWKFATATTRISVSL